MVALRPELVKLQILLDHKARLLVQPVLQVTLGSLVPSKIQANLSRTLGAPPSLGGIPKVLLDFRFWQH